MGWIVSKITWHCLFPIQECSWLAAHLYLHLSGHHLLRKALLHRILGFLIKGISPRIKALLKVSMSAEIFDIDLESFSPGPMNKTYWLPCLEIVQQVCIYSAH